MTIKKIRLGFDRWLAQDIARFRSRDDRFRILRQEEALLDELLSRTPYGFHVARMVVIALLKIRFHRIQVNGR